MLPQNYCVYHYDELWKIMTHIKTLTQFSRYRETSRDTGHDHWRETHLIMTNLA